ncbi:geranylgeranylglycerol-phosphate geranylgeranyltransferase [Flavobacteriaceae bacterium SZ-1-7]|uniref:geranylgeranylglycerol-phosphate geranylgeranyltransferase n=1 Tax=Tamlana sedimenti TaxID=3134126 RepID=UPI00312621A6
MNLLNLIRWKNLLMIALMQLLIKYALLEPFGVQTALDGLGISLLIIATVCIAAAGNIINDIYDVETDSINKPNKVIIGKSISEKTAYNFFIAFNLIGVAIGFYLSHKIGKAPFFSIFVIISILLYIYASYLKRTLLIGNMVISILVALSIIIVGVFELLPTLNPGNRVTQVLFFKVILDYSLFAFTINFLREIAKDIEDIDGDYKTQMNTLPLTIGRERAKNVLTILNFVPLGAIIFYVNSNFYKQPIALGYFLLFVVGPLIYIVIKTFSAKLKSDFRHLSTMYKWTMLFGMLSLLLYKFVILN